MGSEKWIAIISVALFAMFVGEMLSVYNFMINIPVNDEFLRSFEPDPKIIQFVSIGVAPAGILAGVAFLLSKQYGSKQVGGMIIVGGLIMFVGMFVCYSMLDKIDDKFITDLVRYMPILFMILSALVIGVGIYLTKLKKKHPKKEYF